MTGFLNKRKIINDPIYGFITIPYQIIFDLIEHPYFQRLRRIKQLGFTNLVYPGALHTRFHHAIGAMHLMGQAIKEIRAKGHEITEEEAVAVTIAILLHDIGHGPFSHSLENSIVNNVSHEEISILFMEKLDKEFEGKLDLAIKIFKNKYRKKFLHQLVSSQLDVDRLDYLQRDSFYSGVSEGVISADRIIKMLNVSNDQLVIESKGIYSIEKFIIARRLMYWQVYLHKTVLGAEHLLIHILKRAKELANKGVKLPASNALKKFIYTEYSLKDFEHNPDLIYQFAQLDDVDISFGIKEWSNCSDNVLSSLCTRLLNRELFKVELQNAPFKEEKIKQIKKQIRKDYKLKGNEVNYFVFSGSVVNDAYRADKIRINIVYKNGTIKDIAKASDQLNIDVLGKTVKKHFLCYPKQDK